METRKTRLFQGNQEFIIELLSDGEAHSTKDILKALQRHVNDSTITVKNLRDTIARIRDKLEGTGTAIVCEYARRRAYYRHIRLLKRDMIYLNPGHFDDKKAKKAKTYPWDEEN